MKTLIFLSELQVQNWAERDDQILEEIEEKQIHILQKHFTCVHVHIKHLEANIKSSNSYT